MKIIVHCKDLTANDIHYLKSIVAGNAKTKVDTDGSLTTLTAIGSYDDLINIIVQVTTVRNYEITIK